VYSTVLWCAFQYQLTDILLNQFDNDLHAISMWVNVKHVHVVSVSMNKINGNCINSCSWLSAWLMSAALPWMWFNPKHLMIFLPYCKGIRDIKVKSQK
jgi:hypothetical protein